MNMNSVAINLYATGLRTLLLISTCIFAIESVRAIDKNEITFENFSTPIGGGMVYDAFAHSFEVLGYSVTEGQANQIHTGTYNFDYGITKEVLTIYADRSGSSEVAQWYKTNLDSNKNFTIFDHWPGELNWAIKGNLRLTADGEFMIRDMVIAQGHSGAVNNVWIGGKTCFHPVDESDALSCFADRIYGSSEDKMRALVTFSRMNPLKPSTLTISCFGLTR